MLKFLIIDDKENTLKKIISAIRIVAEKNNWYIQITHLCKSDKLKEYEWEKFDCVFVNIDVRKGMYDFKYPDFIRRKMSELKLVFYSEEIEYNLVINAYNYQPSTYINLPIDLNQLQNCIENIYELNATRKILICNNDECFVLQISNILYLNKEKMKILYLNGIYYFDEVEIQKLVEKLENNSFKWYKNNRFLVNQEWYDRDNILLEQLMNTDE